VLERHRRGALVPRTTLRDYVISVARWAELGTFVTGIGRDRDVVSALTLSPRPD